MRGGGGGHGGVSAVQGTQGGRRCNWWAWLAHEGMIGYLRERQSLRRILRRETRQSYPLNDGSYLLQ